MVSRQGTRSGARRRVTRCPSRLGPRTRCRAGLDVRYPARGVPDGVPEIRSGDRGRRSGSTANLTASWTASSRDDVRILSGPRNCARGTRLPGRHRPRGSARTPTPKRPWRSAATPGGCWSSSPPTRSMPRPASWACQPGSGSACSDDELRVANTGAALTAAGRRRTVVLRASAKRDTHDSVGHFGVGFTAVLSWSRAPRMVSTTRRGAFRRAPPPAAEIADLGNPRWTARLP